jgi:hypothetical protein
MWPRAGGKQPRRSVAFVSEIIATTLLLVFSHQAYGQSISQPGVESQPNFGWREVWTGVDAAHDQWLFYSGMTVAPVSRDIYSDGWRVRVGGGYGQYSYDGFAPRPACGDATKNDACTEDDRKAQRYKVNRTYAEVLVGYYLRLGALTAKAFAGASMSNERHMVSDPGDHDDGTDYGVKGALEFWLNLSDDTWTSLDLSYATARNESSSRWRAGWRIKPQISIGPELRYDKNVETGEGEWNGRAGAFVRYEWTGGEVSLAGGLSGRVDRWDAVDVSPYGTLNVLFQF